MIEQWLPMALSLVAVLAWVFTGVGLVDHWRRGWHIPVRALAAGIVAAVSASIAYTITSTAYLDPGLGPLAREVATLERAILATSGIVSLSSLIRSAWRQW